MKDLIVSGDQVSYCGNTYTYFGYDKLDDMCVHLQLDKIIIAFLGGQTKINGVLMNTADEIIDSL
jgi:alcohol dehydrogenase YqhD (iron-dependent ADH family)